jgi:hypothetical protein
MNSSEKPFMERQNNLWICLVAKTTPFQIYSFTKNQPHTAENQDENIVSHHSQQIYDPI